MNTLILTCDDLRNLVRRVGVDQLMDEMTDRLFAAFGEFDSHVTEIPVRTGFYYDLPAPGLIEWMPLFQRQQNVLMKMVGYHPHSPATHDKPTIVSTLSVYDITTGHLSALVDGTFLTAIRTGAASAVASRLLARPESRTLGLIGCGAQAVTQLHAISRAFDLQEVLIHDIDPRVSETFANRAAPVIADSVEIRVTELSAVLARSDIISVATSVEDGKGPVFDQLPMKPWVHINAIGSDLPGKTELPLELLKNSFVCADNLAQACIEGECQQLSAAEIDCELIEVARNPGEYAAVQQRQSVFDSTGWALEDQVAMKLILDYARTFNVCTHVPIECISNDPRSPYEFLSTEPTERELSEDASMATVIT